MTDNPLRVFTHNILCSVVGRDCNSRPIIQPIHLDQSNSMRPFMEFCNVFSATLNGPTGFASVDSFLSVYPAEWQTIADVFRHTAYFPGEFNHSQYAASITNPFVWLGQSTHRLARLTANGRVSPTGIEHVARAIICGESLTVCNALASVALPPDLILFDPDIFRAELQLSEETI